MEEEAGMGGMGVVHRAFDRVTGSIVAVKVLRRADPEAIRRFAMEADALGKIDHPAIVRYLGHGVSDAGEPYLAMEWIDGQSLNARLARGEGNVALEVQQVVALGQRLAAALEAAHAVGLVHRDVKPSNILLPEGRLESAKLVDFGIARADAEGVRNTASGTVVGTVGYVAPEQARGLRDLDGRADLFSLGCVLFRCLTQRDVFHGPAPVAVLAKLLLDEPERVSDLRADVPPALDALIARLLSKRREDRPASAAIVKKELGRIEEQLLDSTLTGTLPRQAVSATRMALVESTEDSIETPPPRRRSRARIALAAIAVAGALLLRGISAAPAPSPALAAPLPVPTSLIDMTASPSCKPAAIALYEEGLNEMHHAAWRRALRLFEQASDADPACAQIELRLIIVGELARYPRRLREHLRQAASLRSQLSERDQRVLDAYTVILAADSPSEEREREAVRLLEEAVNRFPEDAELRFLGTIRKLAYVRDRAQLEAMLASLHQATFIDPEYPDAWQLQARILGNLGRYDDELAALDRCNAAAPDAVDCMEDRIEVLRRTGRCREAAAEARRKLVYDSRDTKAYAQLAFSLASDGADRSAVEEAMRHRHELMPREEREWRQPVDNAKLAAFYGDFESALAIAGDSEHKVALTGEPMSHFEHAFVWVDLLHEVGREPEAARAAARFLNTAKGWVAKAWRQTEFRYYEPHFLAVQLEAGGLTPAQWRTSSEAWEQANQSRISEFERWVLRWGETVGPRIEITEAIRHEPSAEAREKGTSAIAVAARATVLQALEGRLHLYAGDPEAAVPLLETTARACNALRSPFTHMHTHLWLGMAKEKLGDVRGACEAYRYVTDRWGASKLPSVTAREARQRRRSLDCQDREP